MQEKNVLSILQNKKIASFVYILILSITIVFFYYLYLNDKLLEINAINNNISEIQNEISEIQLNYEIIQNTDLKANELNISLQKLKKLINDYFEPHKIIDDLDSIIGKNNLYVIKFNIAQPQKIEIKNEPLQEAYVSTITLNLSGSYENVRNMISDIQTSYNFYKISALRLSISSTDTIELFLLLNSYSKELSKPIDKKSLDLNEFPSNKNPFWS